MEGEAARLGWSWVVVAPKDEAVVILDPSMATGKKRRSLGERARIDNVLLWLTGK